MSLYVLEREQLLPTTLEDAWSFFSDPHNLGRITPPWLSFEVTNTPPSPVHAGCIITYRIRPLANIPVAWTTEITHVDEPNQFVDEQRFGPYRFWHHLHRFRETGRGVLMTDRVHYSLHGGLLAAPVHHFLVRHKLEQIFDYRREIIIELFGKKGENTERH